LKTAGKKWNPLSKTGPEHLCQHTGQTVEESFKLGRMEKGGGDLQLSEEMLDQEQEKPQKW